MHDFLQKASRMHTGTKYLQAALRKMMLFSLYSHTRLPNRASSCYRGVCKAEKSCQKWQSFLLFLRITTVSGPVSPCLLWHGFLLPTHVQMPMSVPHMYKSFRGEEISGDGTLWYSAESNTSPNSRKQPNWGQCLILKWGVFCSFFLLRASWISDLETTNPLSVLVAMYSYEDHSFKTKIPS